MSPMTRSETMPFFALSRAFLVIPWAACIRERIFRSDRRRLIHEVKPG